MKKNIQPILLALISMVFSAFQVNAQNNKSYISSSDKLLPMNRTAFLFCYNNSKAYENPAIAVLNNKPTHVAGIASSSEKNAIQETKEETVCMFPNLTEDELWVELKNKNIQDSELHLEIYNANGERVYNSKMEQNLNKINVCDFTTGTFLVKLGDSVQKIEIE